MVVAAFFRGNNLLGFGVGLANATIASLLLWLLVRSRTRAGRVSAVQAGFVVALGLPFGFAIAFPASVHPGFQREIKNVAIERRVRAEVAAVFASDSAFDRLSISFRRQKTIIVTVRGALGKRADLDRLRSRVVGECPSISKCSLNWDVNVLDSGLRVSGPDKHLFPAAEPNAG